MDVYYYCSYKGSPVGFILGKLSNVNKTEDTLTLSKDNIEPLIQQCFELGMIRKAYGILPQKPDHYFLLLKKLVAKRGSDDLDYYLNVAFVTEDQEQYNQWMCEDGSVTEAAVAQTVRETILVDHESDFGYKISSKALAKLVGKKFGSLLGKWGADGTYFELASQNTDPDDVIKALGLADGTVTLESLPENRNWTQLFKKNRG